MIPVPKHIELVTAANLAELAHAGKFRRDGVTPYIEHPQAVAARLPIHDLTSCHKGQGGRHAV